MMLRTLSDRTTAIHGSAYANHSRANKGRSIPYHHLFEYISRQTTVLYLFFPQFALFQKRLGRPLEGAESGSDLLTEERLVLPLVTIARDPDIHTFVIEVQRFSLAVTHDGQSFAHKVL
jgi:hypothetical protein